MGWALTRVLAPGILAAVVWIIGASAQAASTESHGMGVREIPESFQQSTDFRSGPNLVRVAEADLPAITVEDADQGDWEAGTRDGLRRALTLQLARCQGQSQTATWDFAGKKVTRARYCVETAKWFLSKLDQVGSLNELYRLAHHELQWYRSVGRADTHDVLFTGYNYPELKVKRVADAVYRYPIYRQPSDLVQVRVNGSLVWRRKTSSGYVPYYTRAQIVAGALQGKGLEIAYADNPIDPYMLEVQGSGILKVLKDDGSEENQLVNYAAQNGATYVSLGKLMKDAGISDEYTNIQGIKKYFTQVHPEEWLKYSNQNPSQVFFQEAADGPYGSAGTLLTPKHSIAVDTSEFPMGAVALIQTKRPIHIEGDVATEWKDFAQFVVAQDTGGAIRSPGRVDIYYGSGHYADVASGQTDHTGNLYFVLVPDSSH